MYKLLACIGLCLLFSTSAAAQEKGLDYYLPAGVTYDKSVPTPESVLGYEVGAWHVRPDQIIRYFEALARTSERCSLQTYARSHETRPLVVLTVTSKKNHSQLSEIRKAREGLYSPTTAKPDTQNMPVVLWMGYGVHGDEPSGSNCSLLYAYHLAAAQGDAVEALLDNSVVLLDPCLNPDGLGRFAHWANTHKGKQVVADPSHREHRQPWPSGRTNHYWFDLNRDWLLAQHPESRGRLEIFHSWRPNIVTDFHEMGTNSTYFFQPGVKSRHNPLIPEKNYKLTAKIAEFHAAALNRLGSLYYTRESYDDFYFGKGSTYPDVHGSVGILFEQASARGHAQMNRYGRLSFPFAIRNQFTTSLSSHEAAVAMRQQLLDYQREFAQSSLDAAVADETKAWVFSAPESPQRAAKLVDLLRTHRITVHSLNEDVEKGDQTFKKGEAFVVVGKQPQYRLLKSMFEQRTEFRDPVFYDVSAWNMFAAYDLDFAAVNAGEFKESMLGPMRAGRSPRGIVTARVAAKDVYAWVFDWSSYESAALLSALLDKKIQVLVAGAPFTAELLGSDKARDFARGTIIIPRGIQEVAPDEVQAVLSREAIRQGVPVYGVRTGLTPTGVDLGSPKMGSMAPVKPLIVVGGSVSAYEAGEVWHLLDARLGMRPSLVDERRFTRADLKNYTHIMAVNGAEGILSEREADLKKWISAGGILITQRSASNWAGKSLLGLTPPKPTKKPTTKEAPRKTLTYAERSKDSALRMIGGAVFKATLDNTHPLGWGIAHKEMALWRKGTSVMLESRGETNNPLRYLSDPLVCGFAGKEARKKLGLSAAASVDRMGAGTIVRFADNMNFRAYWRGTERLYLNAIFHARFVSGSGRARQERDPHAH